MKVFIFRQNREMLFLLRPFMDGDFQFQNGQNYIPRKLERPSGTGSKSRRFPRTENWSARNQLVRSSSRIRNNLVWTLVRTLEHVLFGDYYINQKQKRFCRGAIDKGKEPLFCKMILSYIFEIYDHVTEKNKEKAVEFAKKIGVKLYPRDEKSILTSPDSFLLTLMSQWQSLR